MRRIYLLITVLMLGVAMVAQPGWVKKSTKSVFTLKTFKADGTLLGSANGFFVGSGGEAISCFAPFKGAQRAVVIDASGKEMVVECILGANETYDVVKFRVAGGKVQPLAMASALQATGTQVWMLPYREMKNIPQGIIRKAETFNGDYGYYTVALQMPDEAIGAPLLTASGEVVGLMQQPASARDTLNYAVSALFADSLTTNGLSINDRSLRQIGIKKALPTDEAQALLSLYMGVSSLDSASYATMVDDFIVQFPKSHEGYVYKAQLEANAHRYAEADRQIAQALKVTQKAAEVHYSYSRLIYQKALTHPEIDYPSWTLDLSLKEAQEAFSIDAQAIYLQQQAYVYYAQKQYADASVVYEQLFASPLRSPELFYEASRCKEMAGDTLGQLALLDSCVAQFSKPYLKAVAPYLLTRSQVRASLGQYRAAVADLNDYEQLMSAQVNAQFYYLRFQYEMNGRLFQQALNDIRKTIEMEPQNDIFYSEKASLEIRVNLLDDAIATANEAIRIAPDHSDGYLFLGVAQCLKDQKAEGLKNLQKAGELGDPQAKELIEKYSK
ncbi:MAG: tetratricopeptide repeat protein [Prevotella sp.]|nr:tetratricopeptide repeat protein [Prevotella sp.]